jgi:hypothetical protein
MDYIDIGCQGEKYVYKKDSVSLIHEGEETQTFFGSFFEVIFSHLKISFGSRTQDLETKIRKKLEFDFKQKIDLNLEKLEILFHELHNKFGVSLKWLWHGTDAPFFLEYRLRGDIKNIDDIRKLKPKSVYFIVSYDRHDDLKQINARKEKIDSNTPFDSPIIDLKNRDQFPQQEVMLIIQTSDYEYKVYLLGGVFIDIERAEYRRPRVSNLLGCYNLLKDSSRSSEWNFNSYSLQPDLFELVRSGDLYPGTVIAKARNCEDPTCKFSSWAERLIQACDGENVIEKNDHEYDWLFSAQKAIKQFLEKEKKEENEEIET